MLGVRVLCSEARSEAVVAPGFDPTQPDDEVEVSNDAKHNARLAATRALCSTQQAITTASKLQSAAVVASFTAAVTRAESVSVCECECVCLGVCHS